jgi:hypothetical protein
MPLMVSAIGAFIPSSAASLKVVLFSFSKFSAIKTLSSLRRMLIVIRSGDNRISRQRLSNAGPHEKAGNPG